MPTTSSSADEKFALTTRGDGRGRTGGREGSAAARASRGLPEGTRNALPSCSEKSTRRRTCSEKTKTKAGWEEICRCRRRGRGRRKGPRSVPSPEKGAGPGPAKKTTSTGKGTTTTTTRGGRRDTVRRRGGRTGERQRETVRRRGARTTTGKK